MEVNLVSHMKENFSVSESILLEHSSSGIASTPQMGRTGHQSQQLTILILIWINQRTLAPTLQIFLSFFLYICIAALRVIENAVFTPDTGTSIG